GTFPELAQLLTIHHPPTTQPRDYPRGGPPGMGFVEPGPSAGGALGSVQVRVGEADARAARYPRARPEASRSMKTNAARILDRLRIAYEVREYDVDEADLSAPTVARKVGLEPAQVFKPLVTRGEPKGVCFAVVAADAELDL